MSLRLRIARSVDGEGTWIHSDHPHSATILTDADGAEIRRLAYAAFGEEAENLGTGESPKYSYTGKELDTSGLYYYGARYYDPVLSRFITADTVYDSGPQGLNRYSYALNNPILYNDPSGHAVKTPQYMDETSYEAVPYITKEFDTGSDLADFTLATGAGIFNLGAMAFNAPFNMYGVVEEGYNAGTEAVIGQKGFSGDGLTTDLTILEACNIPLGTLIKSARNSGAYLNTYLRAKIPKLFQAGKSVLTSEAGSVYIGKNSKRTEVIARRTNASEAAQMTDANGLVPKPGSRGAKWVSQGKAQTTLRTKGHEKTVIMEVESGTTEWLSKQAVNYDDVAGEASLPSGVLTKNNEPGALGVGVDLLDEFNAKVRRVIVR